MHTTDTYSISRRISFSFCRSFLRMVSRPIEVSRELVVWVCMCGCDRERVCVEMSEKQERLGSRVFCCFFLTSKVNHPLWYSFRISTAISP